ncbi:hypothetical protein PRIPAC_84380 [Pristionchus pacificus]|uniref:Uncharacterized protein n=1 Tax=Pristionchus pacificus TaxID=54126 RepID=A0A454Y6N2_PRIPA|nr:hypothetical protein PRIPAC_84380 [Pristionchus pacificus]|eukprot:PDM69787.1 hypothetical protein PRIPAC_44883 [Pristionchus pacificus]
MISFDDDLSDFRREDPSEDICGPPSSSSSKLASLFEDDSAAAPVESKPAPKPTSSHPRPSTLFSSVVHIFVPDPTTTGYSSFGRGGVALISTKDTKTLLLYTATKSVLTQLPLSSSFPLSLAHPYLYFTAVDGKKWSIVFDDDEQLRKMLAWYLLITQSSTTVFDLTAGVSSAPVIDEGDALLIGVAVYSVDGLTLKITEEPDVKLRLSSKKHKHEWEKHLLGLKKGSLRMIYSTTVILLTVKKVRQRESDSEPRTDGSEPPKDTVPEPVQEPVVEPISTVEESITPESTVLQRMAKLGKPMLGLADLTTVSSAIIDPPPTVSSPPEEEEDPSPPAPIESTVPQESTTLIDPPATVSQPTVPPPSYADFHRVVGLEMDRLQIRLESSFSRMLQESLGPIRDQISRLEQRQEEILQKVQTSSSDKTEL